MKYKWRRVSAEVIKVTSSWKCQKDATTKWNTHPPLGFRRYMTLQRGEAGSKLEDCFIVEHLKPHRRQAVGALIKSGMDDGRRRRLCHCRTKTSVERPFYQTVFRRHELVK